MSAVGIVVSVVIVALVIVAIWLSNRADAGKTK
jgi:hypothetical protein